MRRLFVFLERSIDRGTHWAGVEPDDEARWTNLREASPTPRDAA